jgi:hypothetical protein
LSFNSAVQQFAAGLASFLAGLILAEGINGELVNYDIVGYFAIVLSLLCIPLARRIKVIDLDDRFKFYGLFDKLKISKIPHARVFWGKR